MAYVAPWFMFLHAARASGAVVTCSPAASSSFPLYYAYDGRAQSLFKFGSSGASSYVQIDRGAAGLEAIDYLVIPSGHNLGAQTVTVKSATDAGITTGVVTTTFTSAAGLISQAVTSATSRYWRVTFAGTGTWELPEVWLGRKRTPTRGPLPTWRRAQQPNYQRVQFDSGVTGGNQIGPARWSYGISWQALDSTDLTLFTDLVAACAPAGERFYFMPPDGDITSPLLMEFGTPPSGQQDHPVPGASGPTYTVSLDLIEAIG